MDYGKMSVPVHAQKLEVSIFDYERAISLALQISNQAHCNNTHVQ